MNKALWFNFYLIIKQSEYLKLRELRRVKWNLCNLKIGTIFIQEHDNVIISDCSDFQCKISKYVCMSFNNITIR